MRKEHDDIQEYNKNERCLHCKGAHRAGFKECFVQVRELQMIECQEEHRVGRRIAMQILEGGNSIATSTTLQAQKKSNVYKCTINESHKRQMTPWVLESTLRQHIGKKPKTIRASGKESFLIEVHNEKHGEEVQCITEIKGRRLDASFIHLYWY